MEGLEHNVLISGWENELEELLPIECSFAMEDTAGETILLPIFEVSTVNRGIDFLLV